MVPADPRPRQHDRWMACGDGIRLASRIWTPPGEGPWPLLLMRQPYGRAIASTVTYAHPRWYAERGFLVVVQDVRGRGDSEGEFGGFAQEARDSAAAVRWCRRLKGCNGRVGSYGFSYQGLSQLLNSAAAAGFSADADAVDPLPDCLVPAMCGVDERLHWASEGGAHWWSLGLGWGLQLAAEGCRRRGDREGWRQIRRSLESGAYLEEGLDLLQRHDPEGMGLEWLQLDPAEPAGWRVHQPSPDLLRRPILLIGGWHDPHLLGVLDLFVRSRTAGGRPHLCIGAWSHLDWNGGIEALQLAFLRRHLAPEHPGQPLAGNGRETREAIELPSAFASATGGAEAPGDDRQRIAAAASLACAADAAGSWEPGAPRPPGDGETGTAGEPAVAAETDAAGKTVAARGTEAAQESVIAQEKEVAREPGAAGPPPALAAGETLLLQDLRSGQWCRQANWDPRAERGWRLLSTGLAAIRREEGLLLPCPPPSAATPPAEPAATAAGLTLVHDPWRPVPSRGGHLGPDPGLVERGDLDRRADVACFQTPPLERPLQLLGRPRLRISAAADQPGFDLWAALSVLQVDGRVLQLCTGTRRLLGPPALELQELELAFQPTAAALASGERLRLSLAGAAWPAIAVNPGDGSPPRGGSGPDHRIISIDLGLQAARLWLEPLIGAN